jgi:hypothetical protein
VFISNMDACFRQCNVLISSLVMTNQFIVSIDLVIWSLAIINY